MFDKKIINQLMKWYSYTQWKPAAKGFGSNPCNLVCKYQQVMKMTCTITVPNLKQSKLMHPKLFSRSLSFASMWAKDSKRCSCHGDLPQKGIIRPCGFLKECGENSQPDRLLAIFVLHVAAKVNTYTQRQRDMVQIFVHERYASFPPN